MNFCPNCQQVFETTVTTCPADGTVLIPQLTAIPSDPRQMIGRILENKYTITGVLGSGGMAFVMKARHLFLGRDVAIKILKPEMLTIPELRKRFLREAKAASETKHPGIVDIMDFGITRDGIYYLVMEILEGENLFQYMKRNPCLPETEAARIAVGILEALGAVHARGIVHRDVKPDNFVLQSADDGDLRIKLIDFGLAKFFDDSDPDRPTERLTKCSVVMGSPHHMSPEQARGMTLDARSDIYSVGCILYEMCTGRLPFEGRNSVEVMSKQLVEEPVSPGVHRDDLSEDIENLILGCLCKDPAHRFRTTAELAEAIVRLYPDARVARQTPAIGNPEKRVGAIVDLPKYDAMNDGKPTLITGYRDVPVHNDDGPTLLAGLQKVPVPGQEPAPRTGLQAAARRNKKWRIAAGLTVVFAITAAVVLGMFYLQQNQVQQQPTKAIQQPVQAIQQPVQVATPPIQAVQQAVKVESAQAPEPITETPQPPAQMKADIVVKQDASPADVAVKAVVKDRQDQPKPAKRAIPQKKQAIPKGFIDPFAGPGGK